MKTTSLLLAVGLGALVLPGCASTGMARTVDPGKVQLSLSPAAQGILGGGGSQLASNSIVPQVEVGARLGVTERIDVGARLFFPGAEADVRYGLVRAPSLRDGVDVTLAPSVNFMVADTPWILSLPVLIGFNHDGRQLTLGPRFSYVLQKDPTESSYMLGTSVSYSVPLKSSLRLITELSVLGRPTDFTHEGVLYRLGVGFLFGGYGEDAGADEDDKRLE
jgi:hypothetical protein